MMKPVRRTDRIICALISAVMLMLYLAPFASAFSGGNSITISSEKDFEKFARKCKTDTWSQNKTVELCGDIDLSKADFLPIPTFGGTFDGNGFTVSGIKIKGKGSYRGLFRYIQPSGVVENLNVSGKVAPEGSKKCIGGIAGENSGLIKSCKFSGDVKGETNIGGICGYVTQSGKIYDCSFEGSVTGNSYTGGICGQNFGLIELCENNGSVNTTDNETEKSLQDIEIDISEIGTTESIDAATDTGGICGFSKGKIVKCTNNGDVGYRSVGYNTGGICGRQAGFISECINYGTVNGRKDVGGIVGQAEPYILLEYTKDVLEQVDDVFSRIRSIIDDNSLTSDNLIKDSLDSIDSTMADAEDSIDILSDDIEKYADDIASGINDVSDRMHTALERSPDVLNGISSGTDKMSQGISKIESSCSYLRSMVDTLKEAAESAEKAGDHLSAASTNLQRASTRIASACNELEDCINSMSDGAAKLNESIKALSEALKNKKDAEESLKQIWNNLGTIQQSMSGVGSSLADVAEVLENLQSEKNIKTDVSGIADNIKKLAESYKAIASALQGIRDGVLIIAEDFDIYSIRSAFRMLNMGFNSLSNAFRQLKLAGDDLEAAFDETEGLSEDAENAITGAKSGLKLIRKGMEYLNDSIEELSDIIEEITEGDSVKMPVASEIFGDDFDDFFDSVRDMRKDFSKIKDVLADKKDRLKEEIDSINNQLDILNSVLSSAYDDHIRAEKDGFIEDISDDESFGAIPGKIEQSLNCGKVFADINAGGIVGSLAVEYDFDPEDDIKNEGDKTLDFKYRTKCIVRRCKNEGAVEAKKNYSGGIIGRMDLGSVLSCESYGNVSNIDGDYTGGIAGLSDTVIRNSAVKCELSGVDYVGGICGKGAEISNCFTLVSIPEFGECAGTIAGSAEKEDLKSNFFVSDALGGVDDINYTGRAEETDIDTFVDFVKTNFGTDVSFKLIFTADDKEIARVPFKYKQEIPASSIPKVPEKKGYYGKWSYYDYSEAAFDAVITAEYYRDVELISSSAQRKDGKSVILVCGAFDDTANIKAAKNTSYPDKLKRKDILDSYNVKINGVYTESYTLRYLPKSEKNNINIYAEYDGKLQKLKAKRFGSYLEFKIPASTFTLYEVKKNYTGVVVLTAFIASACAFLIFAVRKKGLQFIRRQTD